MRCGAEVSREGSARSPLAFRHGDKGAVAPQGDTCPVPYLLAILEESWYRSSMASGKEQHKIALSIPRETWEAVNTLAGEHQRSFTKELVWALQEYVRRERKRERER